MARKKKEEGEGQEDSGEISEKELRQQKLAQLFAAANKKYGDGSLVYANQFKFLNVPRISTGILPLDYGLGGGLPVGRVTVAYGPKSTSKSTIFLRAVGNAQKMCSECWTKIRPPKDDPEGTPTCKCGAVRAAVVGWIDDEGVWDDAWAERFVDRSTILLSQPASAEQAIDEADSMLRSGAVDIIVLDSIAFLVPAAEIAKSSADSLVGTQARLVGELMRKFVSGINSIAVKDGRRPTVWATNQIRMKVGVMFGNPETTPGGLAAGFATSCEVRTSGGKYKMDEVTGKPLSVKLNYKVTKNKTGPAHMEGEYDMVLSKTTNKQVGEIADEGWAVDMAVKTGIIDKEDNKNTHAWKGKNYNGVGKMVEHFMDNREDYEELKEQLLPVLLAV